MIVAAGRGERLLPLTRWLPKPALPVRGLPLIAYSLALLGSAGVTEVVINVHYLPDPLIRAARRWCPEGMTLRFSHESELLLTGGAIRRVADFLRESDPCLILGADMILDLDLTAFLARHRASGRSVSLLLCDDPRSDRFGTIGLDAEGKLRRIADRFDLGGESQAGVYTWLNVVSPAALDSLPDQKVFNHLDDWLAPRAAEHGDVGGEVGSAEDVTWIPVGTPSEYLEANFQDLRLRCLDTNEAARRAGVQLERQWILGARSTVPRPGALERVVVWDDETVPEEFSGHDGVYAGGTFHSCGAGDTG